MKAYLDPTEIVLLENAAGNLRDRLLIHILFHLGCRITEALSIKVDDIDFDRGAVTIVHLKHRVKLSCPTCGARLGMHHTFCPGCGNRTEKKQSEELDHHRQRVLPVDKETVNLLEGYIRRGGPVTRDGKKFIFGINRHRAWQIVKGCADKAGLPKLLIRKPERHIMFHPINCVMPLRLMP